MNHYLTTPIYYASGSPHLGHAYTTLLADCYKRYYQLQGDDVLLASGTDEHGQKIERAARAAGLSPEAFIAPLSQEFQTLWPSRGIEVDRFERTTAPAHKRYATAFWRRLETAGDIYLGRYQGLYCVECEQYFTEGTLCPVHRRPLESFSEPSYFFRLGRFQDALIQHIRDNPQFIVPATRRNEVLSFLEGQTLKDLSVSRTATSWGVPVAGAEGHVQYVWVDALSTYLSALSLDGTARFEDESIQCWWRNATHFIGKDILTFHAVYWPALLLSAGLPLPRQLIVNGWLTVEGLKISKSDPSTIVDPRALAGQAGSDALRWYFLKNVSLGQDLDFSAAHFVQTINSDLANNFGNLISRFVSLAQKRLGGSWRQVADLETRDTILLAQAVSTGDAVATAFAQGDPSEGARQVIRLASDINAYFQQQAPWKIGDEARLATTLWTVHQSVADLTILTSPFLPEISTKARHALGLGQASWRQIGQRDHVVSTFETGPVYLRLEP